MASELVERLRCGHPGAFREAVRLHGDAVYGFLLRLAGHRDLADDLFQETWISLAQHATRLAADTKLEAWLFTVARNAWRSHRRWAWVDVSRWAVEEPKMDVASTAPSPEEETAAYRTALMLDDALATLRPKDREIVLLGAVEGLEPNEAAEILGLGPEAYRQRLSRARKALAEELGRRQGSGGE